MQLFRGLAQKTCLLIGISTRKSEPRSKKGGGSLLLKIEGAGGGEGVGSRVERSSREGTCGVEHFR